MRGNDFWHVYNSIPKTENEEINNMKFKAIVGNPPYQVMDGGNSASALPVYQDFVNTAKKLPHKYVSMIMPARWYAGGRGLDSFREEMLNDKSIKALFDFSDSRLCFPTVNIAGGVCYFLQEQSYKGICSVVNIDSTHKIADDRALNEYDVFVRSNYAIHILRKIALLKEEKLTNSVLSSNPFGFRTYARGESLPFEGCVTLITSEGQGYVKRSEIERNTNAVDCYNVIMTRAMSGGNKPSSTGSYQVIPATKRVILPGEICAETYICIGLFKDFNSANNLSKYLSTKFVRFLMLQALTSIMISQSSFLFVPLQDFSRPWTDADLYTKYNLTEDEIAYIEQLIKPMD